MSTAGLINRYVWFITTIYNRGPISLADLQHRYEEHFGYNEVLSERTFHRYTTAVEELFDIDIKYDHIHRGYVIDNLEDIDNMSMRKWLLKTFAVSNMLGESQDLKSRILLENIPSGEQHLTPIVDAMREGIVLTMTYHSFNKERQSTFEVEPWCVKLFKQRWYLLGKSEGYDEPRIYALDRVKSVELGKRKFKIPKRFDAEKHFANFYGIITEDEEFDVCAVALKIDARQSNYMRTLPLHHSQQEVERSVEYSIFEYYLCPSFDFRQKLLSLGGSVEILAPLDLRNYICKDGEKIATNNNADIEKYRFKAYKNNQYPK